MLIKTIGDLRGATRASRSGWLIFHPDTTSGGSYRQNQHAGRITTPVLRNDSATTDKNNHKISSPAHE